MSGSVLPRPVVLLAGFDPIFRVGVERALSNGGADVLAAAHESDDEALVQHAVGRAPDTIVLGDGPGLSADIGARLRVVAPAATIVIWRARARMVVVLAPEQEARVMRAPSAAEVANELFGHSGKGDTCPST